MREKIYYTMYNEFDENNSIYRVMHILVSEIVYKFLVWKTARKSCHVNDKGL